MNIRRHAPVALAIIFAFAHASLSMAQVFRGQVVDSISGRPIVGGLAELWSMEGGFLARTVTSATGVFEFTNANKDRAVLRVLRIGYAPFRLTLNAGSPKEGLTRINWDAPNVSLPGQIVKVAANCRSQLADAKGTVATLWTEAQKALLLTTTLGNESAPTISRVNYDRTLDTSALNVRQIKTKTVVSQSRHAYVSRPAKTLALLGYVSEDSSGTEFHAPDAEVLLSEEFAGTHCFGILTDHNRNQNLIGISFEPARIQPRVIEIRGVLWIDQPTWQLRSLDFEYVGLPDVASSARSGGTVSFDKLPNGEWFVSAWMYECHIWPHSSKSPMVVRVEFSKRHRNYG